MSPVHICKNKVLTKPSTLQNLSDMYVPASSVSLTVSSTATATDAAVIGAAGAIFGDKTMDMGTDCKISML